MCARVWVLTLCQFGLLSLFTHPIGVLNGGGGGIAGGPEVSWATVWLLSGVAGRAFLPLLSHLSVGEEEDILSVVASRLLDPLITSLWCGFTTEVLSVETANKPTAGALHTTHRLVSHSSSYKNSSPLTDARDFRRSKEAVEGWRSNRCSRSVKVCARAGLLRFLCCVVRLSVLYKSDLILRPPQQPIRRPSTGKLELYIPFII